MSYSDFKLSFQISPIILTNGIAASVPGGMLPIISLLQSGDFDQGILSGSNQIDLDDFFAHFEPLAGGELIKNAVGEYPFANQTVAANAIIAQPLDLSFSMVIPIRDAGGYDTKLSVMSALKSSLDQHNNLGGTYTLATPAYVSPNWILLGLTDISTGESKQAQSAYRWDFHKPLLTLEDAEAAQNSLMSKISAATPFNGQPTWSGLQPTVGQPPSLAGPSIVPAQSGTTGSNVAGGSPAPSP